MSNEVPEELLEKAKKSLQGINWAYVIAILGLIGLILFLIWYFFKKRKEGKK